MKDPKEEIVENIKWNEPIALTNDQLLLRETFMIPKINKKT